MANSKMALRFQTDWDKCCLCQKEKNELLLSPPTRYALENDGYSMIATNAPLFLAINELTMALDLGRCDDSGGVEKH